MSVASVEVGLHIPLRLAPRQVRHIHGHVFYQFLLQDGFMKSGIGILVLQHLVAFCKAEVETQTVAEIEVLSDVELPSSFIPHQHLELAVPDHEIQTMEDIALFNRYGSFPSQIDYRQREFVASYDEIPVLVVLSRSLVERLYHEMELASFLQSGILVIDGVSPALLHQLQIHIRKVLRTVAPIRHGESLACQKPCLSYRIIGEGILAAVVIVIVQLGAVEQSGNGLVRHHGQTYLVSDQSHRQMGVVAVRIVIHYRDIFVRKLVPRVLVLVRIEITHRSEREVVTVVEVLIVVKDCVSARTDNEFEKRVLHVLEVPFVVLRLVNLVERKLIRNVVRNHEPLAFQLLDFLLRHTFEFVIPHARTVFLFRFCNASDEEIIPQSRVGNVLQIQGLTGKSKRLDHELQMIVVVRIVEIRHVPVLPQLCRHLRANTRNENPNRQSDYSAVSHILSFKISFGKCTNKCSIRKQEQPFFCFFVSIGTSKRIGTRFLRNGIPARRNAEAFLPRRQKYSVMHIDIITLFPDMFTEIFSQSILKRAREKGLFTVGIHNLRDYSLNKNKNVDDYSYGGGAGMVMQIEPVDNCLKQLRATRTYDEVIYTAPDGEQLSQGICNELALKENLCILCGHYKGVDERIREHLVTREISIGDYVLSGGELAAAVIADSVVRLLPGVLNDESSALTDSFQQGLVSPPVYTRPADYKGWKVPDILLSGNDKLIDNWRFEQSLERTRQRRPDLLNENDFR